MLLFIDVKPDLAGLEVTSAYRAIAHAWESPVVLACSGGVDSTALLLLAAAAYKRGEAGPFTVVHIDHRTRPGIAQERKFVSALCRSLGCPFVSVSIFEPAGCVERMGESQLREARYHRLCSIVNGLKVAGVVTAHTEDDQIETILMRLLSGAAPLAAAGMRRDTVIETAAGQLTIFRPLLPVSRNELNEVLDVAGIEPKLDPTNEDRRYRRNALRLDVIPLLNQIYPGFQSALLRSVELAARDSQYLDDLVTDQPGVFERDGSSLVVDRSIVRTSPAPVATRVIRAAALEIVGDARRELSYERVEKVRLAAGGRTGAVIQLPGGVEVVVERDVLRFQR